MNKKNKKLTSRLLFSSWFEYNNKPITDYVKLKECFEYAFDFGCKMGERMAKAKKAVKKPAKKGKK